MNNPNSISKPTVTVYSCSGCSDAGELADRIARQLSREGSAQMSCLAGIGGRVKSLVSKAESSERILVIDGCPLSCGKRTFELAGFKNVEQLALQNLGLRKGTCPVNDENIAKGVAAAKEIVEHPSVKENPHATVKPIQTL